MAAPSNLNESSIMSLIRPFRGLRPQPSRAAELLAPPYDVVNTAEARRLAEGKPCHFLHVSRAEIDLPEDIDPHDDRVYHQAARVFSAWINDAVLIRDEQPCYYVYRLVMDGRTQIGLVAAASVAAYQANRIRRHEWTRPDKEDDRVRHIEALSAQTGPVLLFYPASPEIDRLLAGLVESPPAMDVTAHDGVRHSVWVVTDATAITTLTAAFEALPALYIADGHHRSAAAARIADKQPDAAARAGFLTVCFPHHQMHIMEYNRLVRDLNGHTPASLLDGIRQHFQVDALPERFKPAASGTFGLYLESSWYRLSIRPERIPADPVGRLDVSLLHRYLIEPLLGIHDPRRDQRIDFVGGIRGLAELEARVDSGAMALGFALYPTRITDLMAVADAGEVMPPKSTWFEPKLADGAVSLVY